MAGTEDTTDCELWCIQLASNVLHRSVMNEAKDTKVWQLACCRDGGKSKDQGAGRESNGTHDLDLHHHPCHRRSPLAAPDPMRQPSAEQHHWRLQLHGPMHPACSSCLRPCVPTEALKISNPCASTPDQGVRRHQVSEIVAQWQGGGKRGFDIRSPGTCVPREGGCRRAII